MMSAAALKRKVSGGPLQDNFEKEVRGIDATPSTENGKPTNYVVFEPYTLTQTYRHYSPEDTAKMGRHINAWLQNAQLPH